MKSATKTAISLALDRRMVLDQVVEPRGVEQYIARRAHRTDGEVDDVAEYARARWVAEARIVIEDREADVLSRPTA